MKQKAMMKMKRMGRLVVFGSVAMSFFPLRTIRAALTDSKDGTESRGMSSSQIEAAQKATEWAVARMNASMSKLGYQGPSITPGQKALVELQQTIKNVRESLKSGRASIPVVNAISVGGLFGEVLSYDEHRVTQPSGNVHSVLSGKMREADGRITDFQGQFDLRDKGNSLYATLQYADGRTSVANFQRSTTQGYIGTIVTKYPYPGTKSSEAAFKQTTSLILDDKGNILRLDTTVTDANGKVVASEVNTVKTSMGVDGKTTRFVHSERVDQGKARIVTDYTDVDGRITGTSYEAKTNTRTTFNSYFENGERVTRSISTQLTRDNTLLKTETLSVTKGDVTTSKITISGFQRELVGQKIQGDLNGNGKPDPMEPWGKFTQSIKRTVTRGPRGLATDEESITTYATGATKSNQYSNLLSDGLCFVPLSPGLSGEAFSVPGPHPDMLK